MEKLIQIFEPVGELLTTKLLKDVDLMIEPVIVPAGKSYDFNEGNVNFSLGAQSSLTVKLLNEEGDTDEKDENKKDEVENRVFSTNPYSLISFNPETTAFLKYETAIFPQAKAGFSLDNLGFDFELSAG